MWNLVRLSLAYHLKALLVAWVIALLLSKLGLVILAIVSVYLLSAEDKEHRLLLHLSLPVTRFQVGWARVVFPAMILLLGAVAVTLLSSAVLGALLSSEIPFGGGAAVAEAARELLLFAALLIFFSQFLLTLGELNVWAKGHGLPRVLTAFAILVLLLSFTLVAWIMMASSGSYLVVVLGTAGLALVLMGITVVLFEQRPSFASG